MTLLYYLKPVYVHRAGDERPPAPKKKRTTFEIIKTDERPRDLHAIKTLAEGVISDQLDAAVRAFKEKQDAAARLAREASKRARQEAEPKAKELQQQIRNELIALELKRVADEIIAANQAETRRRRDEKEAREAREILELHELISLTDYVTGATYEH